MAKEVDSVECRFLMRVEEAAEQLSDSLGWGAKDLEEGDSVVKDSAETIAVKVVGWVALVVSVAATRVVPAAETMAVIEQTEGEDDRFGSSSGRFSPYEK